MQINEPHPFPPHNDQSEQSYPPDPIPSKEPYKESLGSKYNSMLDKAIVQIVSCLNDQTSNGEAKKQQLFATMKRHLKMIQQFQIKNVTYFQCISYYLQSKISYIGEKFKENKMKELNRFNRIHKNISEKIIGGMKDPLKIQIQFQTVLNRKIFNEITSTANAQPSTKQSKDKEKDKDKDKNKQKEKSKEDKSSRHRHRHDR